MPNYEWKLVNWNKYQELELKETIRQTINDGWDYYDAIQVHAGRHVLVFRRQY